jgi:hypothetical protein
MMGGALGELNRYTGLFSAGCLLVLLFCVSLLARVASIVQRFYEDYRTVNSMDELEKSESQL